MTPDLDKYLERLVDLENRASTDLGEAPLVAVANAYSRIVTAICWVLATKDQLECECEEAE